MYYVIAEYPLDQIDEVQKVIEEVTESFGVAHDSGAGFGIRDVSFYTDDESEAWEILSFLRVSNPQPVNDAIEFYDWED
jgi:hypothetical protein